MSKGEQRSSKPENLSTGCDALDDLLDGGFERGVVSQLYGLPSTGKTNICLQTAVETIRDGGSVVYIDTEGVSIERFKQIAGDEYGELADDFIIKEVYDFEEQVVAVRDVEDLASTVDLVILDSATGLYRVERDTQEGDSPLKRLNRQITHLTSLARRYDLAALITNQVYTQVENSGPNEEYSALGGKMMEHWTKTILYLEKPSISTEGEERRRATLEKHRSLPPGEKAEFVINESGVE